jgi:hypothetical protein
MWLKKGRKSTTGTSGPAGGEVGALREKDTDLFEDGT